VLSYLIVGAGASRGALLWRAVAFVIGAAVRWQPWGYCLARIGEFVIGLAADLVVMWYLLVALTRA